MNFFKTKYKMLIKCFVAYAVIVIVFYFYILSHPCDVHSNIYAINNFELAPGNNGDKMEVTLRQVQADCHLSNGCLKYEIYRSHQFVTTIEMFNSNASYISAIAKHRPMFDIKDFKSFSFGSYEQPCTTLGFGNNSCRATLEPWTFDWHEKQ